MINNIPADTVKDLKHLDLTLDSKAAWNPHMNNIVNNVTKAFLVKASLVGHRDLVLKLLCDSLLTLSGP